MKINTEILQNEFLLQKQKKLNLVINEPGSRLKIIFFTTERLHFLAINAVKAGEILLEQRYLTVNFCKTFEKINRPTRVGTSHLLQDNTFLFHCFIGDLLLKYFL